MFDADAGVRRTTILAVVLSVHDGDTITVRIGKRKERVRLIGVDTPETSRNGKFGRDARRDRRHTPARLLRYGREARAFTCPSRRPAPGYGLSSTLPKGTNTEGF